VNILQGLRVDALASGFKQGEFIGDTKLSPTFIRCHHHHRIAHEKRDTPYQLPYGSGVVQTSPRILSGE
jgi:hypothetical protein